MLANDPVIAPPSGDMEHDIWKVILDCDMAGKKRAKVQVEGGNIKAQKEGKHEAKEGETQRETDPDQVLGEEEPEGNRLLIREQWHKQRINRHIWVKQLKLQQGQKAPQKEGPRSEGLEHPKLSSSTSTGSDIFEAVEPGTRPTARTHRKHHAPTAGSTTGGTTAQKSHDQGGESDSGSATETRTHTHGRWPRTKRKR